MADFTPDESTDLALIWERLYQLYLERAMGDRTGPEIDTEIEELIRRRDAIRAWGWSTGRNWAKGMPAEELTKIRKQ